jgi:hypothetical protein
MDQAAVFPIFMVGTCPVITLAYIDSRTNLEHIYWESNVGRCVTKIHNN